MNLKSDFEIAEDYIDVFGERHASRSRKPNPKYALKLTEAFVGRIEELAEIAALLADSTCRLLTLVGPGGIGKTRLALEAAARCDKYANRIHFIPLQPLNSPDFIVPTIAQVIGFQFYSGGDPKQQLLDYLCEKPLLLVLDNFEHLLDGVLILSEILKAAPGVKLLVTARERLNLIEEWVLDIDGLSYPSSEANTQMECYSAVQLFVQRACQVQSQFSPDDHIDAIISICRLVEGMPLGVELAAGWVRVLPCEQIADEIRRSLDILETPTRNVELRHRNMRAAFEPTWERLCQAEREVFMKLSVFRGGFSREAAEYVAGATLSSLSSLMDKSLVRLVGNGQFEIHELLRQYSEEHLREDADAWHFAHDQHCGYYADFLHQCCEQIMGNKAIKTLQAIESQLANVRACWHWALTYGATMKTEMALDSLWFFYDSRTRFHEGERLFAEAVAAFRTEKTEPVNSPLLGKLLARQGSLCYSLELVDKARVLLQESLDILRQSDSPADLAFALLRMGSIVLHKWPGGAQFYFQESHELYQRINDIWGMGQSLLWLGITHEFNGDQEQARQICFESLAVFEQVGHSIGAAQVKSQLSQIAAKIGDFYEARRMAQAGLEIFQEAGVIWGIVMSYERLCYAFIGSRDYATAARHALQSLAMAVEYGLRLFIFIALRLIARLRIAQNRIGEAVEMVSFLATQLDTPDNPKYALWLDELQPKLPAQPFMAAVERGSRCDLKTMSNVILAGLREEVEGKGFPDLRSEFPYDPLTQRELEMLRLVAAGLSNAEIAQELYIALATVKVHSRNIFSKLSVSSRTQAIAQAHKLKLL